MVQRRSPRGLRSAQPFADFFGNARHLGVGGHLQHQHRVHEGDHKLADFFLSNDDIAGQ